MRNSDLFAARSQRPLAIAIWSLLLFVAVILYVRQKVVATVGDTNASLVMGALLAGFASLVSLFAWFISRQSPRAQASGLWQVVEGLCTLMPPGMIAIALLPIESSLRPWLLGLMFVGGAAGLLMLSDHNFLSHGLHKFHRREHLFGEGTTERFLRTLTLHDPLVSREPARTIPPAPVESAIDGRLQQRFDRVIADDGRDKVSAKVLVSFEAGQKRSVIHIPFSPAFEIAPEVECDASPNGLRLKVADAKPYGLRIEARRSDAATASESLIAFVASAPRNAGVKQPAAAERVLPGRVLQPGERISSETFSQSGDRRSA